MNGVELSGAWIAGLLYTVVSVGLEYHPGFAGWWTGVSSEFKRLLVGGAALAVTAALVGLHYAGAFGLGLPEFGWPVVIEALKVWVAFMGGNWAIWSLLERSLPRKRG